MTPSSPRALRAVAVSLAGIATTLLAVSTASATPGCGAAITQGSGAVGDPYLVGNQAQLASVGVGACGLGAAYRQTADIALTGTWTPIAAGSAFSGTYDGGGHAVTGLSVTSGDSIGLFSSTSAATLTHVRVAGSVSGGYDVGLLVGAAFDSTITDVVTSGTVAGSANDLGGVVGVAGALTDPLVISDATSSATVTGTGGAASYRVGGIAGLAQSDGAAVTLSRVTASGAVSTAGGTQAGGITGALGDSAGTAPVRLDHARASGSVSASSIAGGLVGDAGPANGGTMAIEDSRTWGTVQAPGGQAGGVVGNSPFGTGSVRTIIRVAALGDVVGASFTGGLVGRAFTQAGFPTGFRLTDSYARGAVTGGTYTAGMIGNGGTTDTTDSVIRGYASGAITASAPMGGIGGTSSLHASSATFWNPTTTGQPSSGVVGGTAATSAQMSDIATFTGAGWGIVRGWAASDPAASKVWGICSNVNAGEPFLLGEYSEGPCVPGAPTGLVATAGVSTAAVAFTPDSLGSTILRYEYSVDGGEWTSASQAQPGSPVQVTGLTPGATVGLRLRAVATAGAGAASGTTSVAVQALPPSPPSAAPATTPSGTPAAFALAGGRTRRLSPGATVVRTSAQASGPGVFTQRGTITSPKSATDRASFKKAARRLAACTSMRRATAEGTYALTCALGKSAKATLRRSAITLSVVTTFTPTGGAATSQVQRVTIPRARLK